MSLFSGPEEHHANAPATWLVSKVEAGRWRLTTSNGTPLDTFRTKHEATEARQIGDLARLWVKESRWYNGEEIPGWRPWADCLEERRRIEARWSKPEVTR